MASLPTFSPCDMWQGMAWSGKSSACVKLQTDKRSSSPDTTHDKRTVSVKIWSFQLLWLQALGTQVSDQGPRQMLQLPWCKKWTLATFLEDMVWVNNAEESNESPWIFHDWLWIYCHSPWHEIEIIKENFLFSWYSVVHLNLDMLMLMLALL